MQRFGYVILWLTVVCSGLGTTACCFLGHASLLDYAGVEEKTTGEGGERADGGTGGPKHFNSEHQAHSAGPERSDEPSQQSGIHCLTEIHPRYVDLLPHTQILEEVTQMSHKNSSAFFFR